MRYPKNIQPGDTLGFVAPSFACVTEPYHTAFQAALNHFHEMGYQTSLGPNCYADNGIGISNTPAACGAELTEYYCSPDNQALLSCGGGECMCEVIPYMDFDAMAAAPPKWYMGYSDNTNFTFLANTILDTAAIYGPCANEFGMSPWHPAIHDAFGILTGEVSVVHNYDGWESKETQGRTEDTPLAPYHITEPYVQRIWLPDGPNDAPTPEQPLVCSGRLIGGCVDCLVTLLGTRFDKAADFVERYADDGLIWFLECCDLNTMSIRRAMWQMREAGWFSHVKAFLIGRSLNGSAMFGTDQYAAVTDLLGCFHVPILMDLDLGHLSPMMPIVSGAMAEVTATSGTVSLRYQY